MPVSPALAFAAGALVGAGLAAIGYHAGGGAHRRAVRAVRSSSVHSMLYAMARLERDGEMPGRLTTEVEHLQDLARAVLRVLDRELR